MSVSYSRTECLVGGVWLVVVGGDVDHKYLHLDDVQQSKLPGEVGRGESGGRRWAKVRKDAVQRRVRHDVSTVFDGVPATVSAVHEGQVELYNGTGQALARGWQGNPHDGWFVWVPEDEVGEVEETVTELSPAGKDL